MRLINFKRFRFESVLYKLFSVFNALVRKLEKRPHLGCGDFVCRFDSDLGHRKWYTHIFIRLFVYYLEIKTIYI